MFCLEYTLNHNQKKTNYIHRIHVHLELAQTITNVQNKQEEQCIVLYFI